MTGARTQPATIVLTSLVTALTTWITLFSWKGFSDASSTYLTPLLLGCLAMATAGGVLRWFRVHPALILLGQLLLAGLIVMTAFGGSPLPTGDALAQLRETFGDSIAAANKYAAPVPYRIGSLQAPLVTLGLLCAIVVDFVACTLRRVPLSGLPLLTVYSVPVSLLDGVSWWVFVLSATGFMVMLFLQEDAELTRWGWPLTPTSVDRSGFGVRTGRNRTTAFKVGAAAAALGVFLPIVIPTLSLSIFSGSGTGGDGKIKLENPMTDLRRDLLSREDRPLLQVTTNDPNPRYLRVGVLTWFTGEAWQPGNRDLDEGIEARGSVPDPSGVSPAVKRTPYDYTVNVTNDFESEWLPIKVPLTRVQAGDNWRYDPSTQDLVSADEDASTAGLDYSFGYDQLEYDQESLIGSPAAVSGDLKRYVELPGLPPSVVQAAHTRTDGYQTKYEKAVALQDWFRSDFDYSLQTRPETGDAALTSFLEDKSGYCEQFAGTMALMARELDIPSRVALGFLSPDRVGGDRYEYSTNDLHAWVELYFPGSGWVLFDPTPSDRVAETPSYTQNLPSPSAQPSLPTVEPSRSEITRGSQRPEEPTQAATTAEAGSGAGSGSSIPWRPILIGLGAVALLLLLLLLPRWLRRVRSERRWRSPGGAEAAWAELRDVLIDHRLVWPDGRSPRETGARVAAYFAAPAGAGTPVRPERGVGVNPDADAALTRILLAVERLRYSPRGDASGSEELRADVATCTAAIAGGVTPRIRRGAVWWPRSVVGARRARPRRPGGRSGGTRATGATDPAQHVDQVEELVT